MSSGCANNYLQNETICDVIPENPAYGGAISGFLDQPFPYVYIHGLYCAESGESIFLQIYAHM